ncbi:OPT family small oligopeptide transporter [Uncinocarpus reesii 1704]|uniref:OPT family small oligopeptide transporter n=1 Tax=Uncinocarpus reesii (strain UAMH 1704) TaxID=336963 RepID=C4JHI2_UNCRE|nr:OPT family small oligopeptide transporter [Uncinocarpus reesii 1704]EEP76496.1 OPT family small oligopeptide transporter [Uncinocarpus reesii 1704]
MLFLRKVRDRISLPLRPKGIEKIGLTSSATEDSHLEANRKLHLYHRVHRWDPNLDDEYLDEVHRAANSYDGSSTNKRMAQKVSENSPYPEVRAAVRNKDEDVPVDTIRAWTIGIFLTTVGSGLNSLFALRAPSIVVSSMVALLIAHPLGLAWAKVMPNKKIKVFGREMELNPGRFNIKEHALIAIMANASIGNGHAYFANTILAQVKFYNTDFGTGSCYSFAFLRLLADHGSESRGVMGNMSCNQYPNGRIRYCRAASSDSCRTSPPNPATTNGWRIPRYRYFLYLFTGAFIWYWFPGFIAPFLSVFAFATWIKPNNPLVNQLFGGWTGLSLIPITFDWTQIAGYVQSPLIPPWHAIGNTMIGTVVTYLIVTPILHYTNHWYARSLPIHDSTIYDNTGHPYDVSKVLDADRTFDLQKYKAYSPVFLPTTMSMTYGLNFAAIAALIVHTVLFHGQQIWIRARDVRGDLDDIHTRMMRKYPKVPVWWYLVLLSGCLVLCFLTCVAWPTHLPWWGLLIALLIAFILTVPIGIIQGSTNIQIGLNVFTEYIVGYMLPGRPLGMMLFKTYGYISMAQGLSFIQDLKLGHYLKINPRSLFWAQVLATLWSCFVQLGVIRWSMGNIEGICERDQPNRFTCPNGRVFFAASILWGLIGPRRIFSGKSIYAGLQYYWVAGALAPIVFYIIARIFPRSRARFVNTPILFGGTLMLPPATTLNYLAWGIVGVVFQKHIRYRFTGWWMRYNYITSAALDTGLAISTIVIVTAFQLSNISFPSWWGNTTALQTMDQKGTAIIDPLAPGETFGPKTW